MRLSFHLKRWPFIRNKMMAITPNQGVSIEIISLFNSKGDKRIIIGFFQSSSLSQYCLEQRSLVDTFSNFQ